MVGRGGLPQPSVACASRPHDHSAVLAPSRTLRAGAERRGRCAASRTAPARVLSGFAPSGRWSVILAQLSGARLSILLHDNGTDGNKIAVMPSFGASADRTRHSAP